MRNIFIILFFILLSVSCERHTQESNVTGEKKSKVVNLSVIETISSAISQNDLTTIKETLDGGDFEINVPNKDGELILNKAVALDRFIIGKILLDSGADPLVEDKKGKSAKLTASELESKEDWEFLFDGQKIREGTSKDKVFEYLVAAREETEDKFLPLFEGLFKLGAPVDGTNSGQFTYLMEASSRGLIKIVEFLCTLEGLDPNVKVERGRGRRKQVFTALVLAKNDQIKQSLYACGAVDL